jgi:hypothetical protein
MHRGDENDRMKKELCYRGDVVMRKEEKGAAGTLGKGDFTSLVGRVNPFLG